MGGFELFFRQLLTVVGSSFPTVLLVSLLCWWGLRSKKTGTPTAIAACRSVVACLIVCFFYAILLFQTPDDFRRNGAGGTVFIAIVGSVIMMALWPGKAKLTAAIAATNVPLKSPNDAQAGEAAAVGRTHEREKPMQNLNASIIANWPILLVIALMACAWMFRYQPVSVGAGNSAAIYVIDRWTGSATLYGGAQYYNTRPVAK